MIKIQELTKYISNCKHILRQISMHGDNLRFETWIHRGTIKVSDEYTLETPDIYFDVAKYKHFGETPYRFTLHRESVFMQYPKHRKVFNRIFAPIIFRACDKKYKNIGKQK